jgi:predicted PurR-regulated permease PerM
MLGRLVSMFAVGLLTGLMLWAMGVPLAALLGLVAGLLTFVPYAGPIAASVPIGLVALVEGPMHALLVLALYTVIQSVEGFLITPLVQQRAVHLAPALTLFSEFFLGMLVGPLGVVLSVPLAAAVLVLVQKLYVEGVLEGAKGPGPSPPEDERKD